MQLFWVNTPLLSQSGEEGELRAAVGGWKPRQREGQSGYGRALHPKRECKFAFGRNKANGYMTGTGKRCHTEFPLERPGKILWNRHGKGKMSHQRQKFLCQRLQTRCKAAVHQLYNAPLRCMLILLQESQCHSCCMKLPKKTSLIQGRQQSEVKILRCRKQTVNPKSGEFFRNSALLSAGAVQGEFSPKQGHPQYRLLQKPGTIVRTGHKISIHEHPSMESI